MKLEEGMYIRTKAGKIAKIINKYDNSGSIHKENFVWVLDDSNVLALHSQKVVKASYNLIDLIEVGDYVNGKEVTYVYPNLIKVDSTDIWEIHSCDIKSIVTKEQFESVKYEVE